MRASVLPVKFIGGTLALGSGLALGREGPTVQMGATLACLFAHKLRFRAADNRALLAAGAGAGLAAAFNAPLAGVVFVFEELVRRFELRVAVASLAACSAALAVMRALIGKRLEFAVPAFEVELFPGYLLFLVFGGLIGLLGVAYNRLVVAGLDVAERMHRITPEVRAALVGGIFGLLACITPALVGGGETLIQSVLDGGQSVTMLVVIFAARLVLGPLSYAPGLPGGLFAPLLVVGAASGALFGRALEAVLPVLTTPTAAFAAVGSGGPLRRGRAGAGHRHRAHCRDDRRNGAVHPVADRVRRRGRGTDGVGGPGDLRCAAASPGRALGPIAQPLLAGGVDR